jgi:dienelactone hydrolase
LADIALSGGYCMIDASSSAHAEEIAMADVLLFHHAQGLTSGVRDFAGELERAGHTVHLPDLYDSRTFDDLDAGVAHADAVGFGTIMERGRAAADALPAGLVYAGFSLGVLPAQLLAQTRLGARGAVLCHSCVPVSEFGGAWPAGVPVQIHGMDGDPFFAGEGDIDVARALTAENASAELFVYPGEQHLFADRSLPSYVEPAASLLTQRVITFLDGLD